MLITVEELLEHPVNFDEVFAPGHIDYLTDGLRQVASLRTQGAARLLENEIEIRGRLATTMEAVCARCLEPVRHEVDLKYDLVYRPTSSITRADEFEVPHGEEEIGFYTGPGLLLEDVAKEQVLLSLPMRSICSGGQCRGLCPICGRNLNHESCDCAPPKLDQRWEGLLK